MKLFSFFKKDKEPRRAAIIDVTDDNFELQVVRRSYKSPVMVDFWADWCAPCRQLGPTLERLAEEPDGEFILAKLNTEHNRRTAQKYGIRSIPNVKMFRNGEVVDEFTGAIPGALVKRFISKNADAPAPNPNVTGSGNPAKRLHQAEQHLKKGRGFEAHLLLDDFPDGKEAAQAERLLPLARFLWDMEDGDALTGLDDLDDAYTAVLQAMKKRRPAKALAALFAALDVGEEIDRPYTTRVIEGMLALLGDDHQLTQQYRPQLATEAVD